MKERNIWPGLLSLGIAFWGLAGCSSKPGNDRVRTERPIARWHFVGGAQLQQQRSAPTLATLLTGTNSGAAGERFQTNLVQALLARLGTTDPAGQTTALAPLLGDLLRYESAGEISTPGWRFTIRLPAERLPLWQSGIAHVLRLEATGRPTSWQYTNGWLTAGAGLTGGSGWLALSNGAVLAADGDLARLTGGLSAHWPRATVQADLLTNRVVLRGALHFEQAPLSAGPLPAWTLPERAAHPPFSQFTAARGVGELMGRLPWWRSLFDGHPPDQFFYWSQPAIPFRNWLAVPTKNSAGDLERILGGLNGVFGEPNGRRGRPLINTNRDALVVLDTMKGLQPLVTRVPQGQSTLLVASLFAPERTTNPIPVRLRDALASPDVVYHDAEFTPESIEHWNVLFQLDQMLQARAPNARNARAHAWMWDNRVELGDATTLVRQVSPTDFRWERTSSLGVTGLELVLLTRWLDGPITRSAGAAPPLPVSP